MKFISKGKYENENEQFQSLLIFGILIIFQIQKKIKFQKFII